MMTAPHPQHFLHVYPGPFGNEHALQMGGPGNMMMQGAQLLAKAVPIDGSLLTCSSFPNAVDADTGALRQQLQLQAREIHRLQGTASHYRSWAAQLQARYQMFSPDAARPAKRVYIGNLPADMSENDLRLAINDLMIQIGGVSTDGLPVVACKLYTGGLGQTACGSDATGDSSRSVSPRAVASGSQISPRPISMPISTSSGGHLNTATTAATNSQMSSPTSFPRGGGHMSSIMPGSCSSLLQDKSYAFVEFRSVEEASNCMALDGVRFKDTCLKIRRPNNYDPSVAIMLGPIEPSPGLDLAALDIVRTIVQDSPHKVFIGGLPCDWTEEQVTEMLLPFGTLKAFNLVMDRATGNSRGYAFCEFNDVTLTDAVIRSLHGKAVGNKYMTVKRALAGPASSSYQ